MTKRSHQLVPLPSFSLLGPTLASTSAALADVRPCVQTILNIVLRTVTCYTCAVINNVLLFYSSQQLLTL